MLNDQEIMNALRKRIDDLECELKRNDLRVPFMYKLCNVRIIHENVTYPSCQVTYTPKTGRILFWYQNESYAPTGASYKYLKRQFLRVYPELEKTYGKH